VNDLSIESFLIVDCVVGEDAKHLAGSSSPGLLSEGTACDSVEGAG
jgi:hypothetical protein